jgi:putative endonuclease
LSTVVGFTQQKGSEAEDRACRYLQAQGLTLVQRNYRVARGPHRRGGEIDLIMRTSQGTLVFVEVRARAQACQGGAGASVTPLKQRRLVLAARHYLLRCSQPPPCRFDVVALEGSVLHWWPGAFEATA